MPRPRTAPGVSQWLPLPWGEFGGMLRDPLAYFSSARNRFGDLIRIRIGPTLLHVAVHPDVVRRILIDDAKLFVRGWHYGLLRRLMGANLVVTDGPEWLRHRRLSQPAFVRSRLASYAQVMQAAVQETERRWDEACTAGKPLDVHHEMTQLTLAIATRTLFGQEIGSEEQAIAPAFEVAQSYLEYRFNHIATSPPTWVPTRRNREFRRKLAEMNAIVAGIITRRRSERHSGSEAADRDDLLSRLLSAQDAESRTSLSDDEVRSTVLAFLLAGHETTAMALTWMLLVLADEPALRERLRAESSSAEETSASVADLDRIDLVRCVIDESLRLYPPVWGVIREATQEVELGGFTVPSRTPILVSPYLTQRHPEFWPDSDRFDPERFAAGRREQIPRGAMFPFLAGPHVCIGQEFALLEMRIVLARLIRRFDWSPVDGPRPEPKATIVLRPSGVRRIRLARAK